MVELAGLARLAGVLLNVRAGSAALIVWSCFAAALASPTCFEDEFAGCLHRFWRDNMVYVQAKLGRVGFFAASAGTDQQGVRAVFGGEQLPLANHGRGLDAT